MATPGYHICLLLEITIVVVFLGLLFLLKRRRAGNRHARYYRKAQALHGRFQSGEMTGGRALMYLRKLNPYVFEELVLEALKDNGFRVCRNKRYSGDGGIDGRVFKNGEEYYVQCKRYASHIDMQHVRDFVELCRKDGKSGLFVHTGKTDRGAWNVLSDGPSTVEIISGGKLLNLLAKNTKQSS